MDPSEREGKAQHCCDSNKEDDDITPHGPKHQRIPASLIDVCNGQNLEALGTLIENSEAAMLSFEQHHLDFEKCLHKDMLQGRVNERADRRKTEKCKK